MKIKVACTGLAFVIALVLTNSNAGCGDRGAPHPPDAGLTTRRTAFGTISPQGGTITGVTAGSGLTGGGIGGNVTLTANLSGGTCGVGSAVVSVSALGVVTCGTAGVANAAGVNVIPVSTGVGSGLGSSGETDDGTTFTTSRNEFITGTLTGSGAVVNKSTETVWGNWTGSGDVALGDASADAIAFNGSASTTLNMNTHTIIGVVDPTNPQDAATRHYVDSVAIVGAITGTTNRVVKFTATNAIGDALGTINLGSASSDTLTVAATATFNAPFTAAGNFTSTAGTTTVGNFRGATIAPSLTGGATVNDWAPTGNGIARTIFANCPSGTCTITGLVSGADGRKITIYNTGAGAIALPNNSGSSTASNRWNNATGTEVLAANSGCSADYTYSTADNFWHLTGEICDQWTYDGASITTTHAANMRNTSVTGWVDSTGTGYFGGDTSGGYISNATGTAGTTLGFGFGTNAAFTGYINELGYNEGTTQPRSLRIQDGQGSAASHSLAFFDGANNGVTLGSGAVTTITVSNTPTGINAYRAKHFEYVDEALYPGAVATSTVIAPPWALFVNGGASGIVDNGATGRPGFLTVRAGATATNGNITLISGLNSLEATKYDTLTYEWHGQIAALSSGVGVTTTNYSTLWGFISTPSAIAQTDGCFFGYDKQNLLGHNAGATHALTCECIRSSDGTNTGYLINGTGNSDESFALGTAVLSAATVFGLKVVITGTGSAMTRAEFYFDSGGGFTKVCDINTHAPTGFFGTGFETVKNASTGNGSADLQYDYQSMSGDLHTARTSP